MHLKNEDLKLLLDIERYLWNTGDKEFYYKLWGLNERLIKNKIEYNKINSKRVAEKRKIDKNYAR